MIRAVMLGRLGNNLFQYAMGRYLSHVHGVPLVMDASWFNEDGWNQVKCIRELPGPAAGHAKIVRRVSLGSRLLRKVAHKHHWEYIGVPVLRENTSEQAFSPAFRAAPADCVLFGYFQSPRYFEGIEEKLRAELSTDGLGLERGYERLAERLRQADSVAVHVRRTDYVNHSHLNLCGLGYYKRAIAEFRNTLTSPRFYIFSDDPVWCRQNLTASDSDIIDPDSNPLVDLHLMSLANHHLIANSSYSWWSAWLGKKAGQIVKMPDRWLGNPTIAPIADKNPGGWTMVPCDDRS